ncbi:MAG TPA: alternative ribosome rescue aminoacyl-tRNA hydrolase ArfB [Gemmatimonadaceae bacterium]
MSDGIKVDARVEIPRDELVVRATRAGGPGGQHVNTSSTRIELLWNPTTSRALDDAERARVEQKLVARRDAEGFVRIVASEHRSQRRNRTEAEARLAEVVRRALVVPKRRVRTRVPRRAVEQRLAEKKAHGDRKRSRRLPNDE